LTTVRERIEEGQFYPWLINYFVKHKGQVPLCCFSSKKGEKGKKGWVVNCTWLHSQGIEDMPYPDFKKKCLKCQEEIEQKIKDWDEIYNGKEEAEKKKEK
jgi:hypothetical protein